MKKFKRVIPWILIAWLLGAFPVYAQGQRGAGEATRSEVTETNSERSRTDDKLSGEIQNRLVASIGQTGASNNAFVEQSGTASAYFLQQGILNSVNVRQTGSGQSGIGFQAGVGNSLSLTQADLTNHALINQHGAYNSAEIIQAGSRNKAFVEQKGTFHSVTVEQYGSSGVAKITQAGQAKSVKLIQY